MGSVGTLFITVNANTTAAVKGLQNVQKQTQATANTAKQAAGVWDGFMGKMAKVGFAVTGINALVGAVTQLGGAIIDLGMAAEQEARSQRQLGYALDALSGGASGATAEVEAFIQTLSEQTGFLDNELRAGFIDLMRQYGDASIASERLMAATDLAASGFGTLRQAVHGLESAFDEVALRRGFGAITGVARREVETTSGLVMQWQRQLEMLKENIGGLVAPIVGSIFEALGEAAGRLNQFFTDVKTIGLGPALASLLTDVLSKLQQLITGILDWFATTGWPKLVEWLSTNLPRLAQWIADSLPVWTKNLVDLFTKVTEWFKETGWPTLVKWLGDRKNDLAAWIAEGWPKWRENFGNLMTNIMNNIPGWVTSLLNEFEKGAGSLAKWIADPNNVQTWITNFGSLVGDIAKWVLTTGLPKIMEAFGDIVTRLPGWVGNVAKWLLNDGLKAILNAAVGFGSGLMEGILSGLGALKDRLFIHLHRAWADALEAVNAKLPFGGSDFIRGSVDELRKAAAEMERIMNAGQGGPGAGLEEKRICIMNGNTWENGRCVPKSVGPTGGQPGQPGGGQPGAAGPSLLDEIKRALGSGAGSPAAISQSYMTWLNRAAKPEEIDAWLQEAFKYTGGVDDAGRFAGIHNMPAFADIIESGIRDSQEAITKRGGMDPWAFLTSGGFAARQAVGSTGSPDVAGPAVTETVRNIQQQAQQIQQQVQQQVQKAVEVAFAPSGTTFASGVMDMNDALNEIRSREQYNAYQRSIGGQEIASLRYDPSVGRIFQAAHGFDGVLSRPHMFMAGEAGPERVTVTPLGLPGARSPSHGGAGPTSGIGGATFNISVGSIDSTARLDELQRAQARLIRLYGGTG